MFELIHTYHRRRVGLRQWAFAVCVAAAMLCVAGPTAGELPPVPVPEENPQSEARRVLGKILFWDEQLSYDDTVACGTCHRPGAGGADPRAGRHPGTDPGTIDDVFGSPGVVRRGPEGNALQDPVFDTAPQVTARSSPSHFMALWAESVFWDGRAGPQLIDPLNDAVVISRGGALEAQALQSLSNAAEMSRDDHDWQELTRKLERVRPLALATDWPDDVAAAIEAQPDYPQLFSAAFGNARITPIRIAFALAAWQRTLIADQTAWDRMRAGDQAALSPAAQRGWRDFQAFQCTACHAPPLFTNNDFANIGLRLTRFDAGRLNVTGDPEDAGEMKVPSLRNVALRSRFMHTGQFATLGAAVGFYLTGPALEDRDNLPGGSVYSFNMGNQSEADIGIFLAEGLTDPRVRDEQFPFDRPTLRSEQAEN